MTLPMILAPLFVLVLMTLVIGTLLAASRTPPLLSGEIRPEDIVATPAELAEAGLAARLFVQQPVRDCRCCSTC